MNLTDLQKYLENINPTTNFSTIYAKIKNIAK